MNISEISIRRPVATSLLACAVLLGGAVAYKLLPVAPLPEIELPTIAVGAALPGASPETMASAVATPLERQFGRIAGVTQMTSSSTLGQTGITLQFDLNRNIDAAARDVQAAINAARGQLPANLPGNPGYQKVNPANAPVIILAMTSDVIGKPQMYDYAESILAQKISQIKGVGQVFVGGSSRPGVRIDVNPEQLSNYGIGLEGVRQAISKVNTNIPKGALNNSQFTQAINDNDQLLTADLYRPLVVRNRNGNAVRLSDIAQVTDSVENIYGAGLFNGKPAILLIVTNTPGANIIETADAVKKVLPFLQASIPPTIDLVVSLDRTTTIRASFFDVQRSLLIAIVLVVLVVFAFLRDGRSTLIPSVSVPLSLIGTFGVMYLCGYTLDNFSLIALTVSTGFVVDDAIVVMENITRYIEEGVPPYQAAVRGAKEISFTVLSMSLSLVAVFIPILLMGGIVGRLFREFAVTLTTAILVSLIVSLTVTPMMCARFLKPHERRRHGALYRFSEGVFNHMHRGYEHGLKWVLRHQGFVLAIAVLTVVVNVALFTVIPKGFFPSQDTGRIVGSIRASQDISFFALQEKQIELSRIMQQDPAVQTVMSFIGQGNTGRLFAALKPLNERKVSADQVINRLRGKLSHVPGANLILQAAQEVQIGGRQSDALYQYTLQDENLAELNEWIPRLVEKLQTNPLLRDISSDQQNQGLQVDLRIDRDTAARLGVTPQTIDATLYDAFGQRQVSTIFKTLNQYHVVMEVSQQFQQDPDALRKIYVASSTGEQVPLSTFAHFESSRTPLSVNHQGQFPAVTISFNLAPNIALGQAVDAIERARIEIGAPSTLVGGFQGSAQAFQSSLSTEPLLILAALIAIYIVLGMLYESVIHPITILSTLPSAGVGALLALMLVGMDLSVIAIIGIILLIGIVKKNAIMMIDFALLAEREHGKSPEDAIYEACMLRFRPIMMTTMAALLGGLPLALGQGTGSELRRPLGIAIVGGLIVSQMLTLYTTPVVYLFFDKMRWRILRWRGQATEKRLPRLMEVTSRYTG
ncbi:MAG TPA: multidrug efflux RND transporter permease subunit [Acidobacteriaceae bacterium]|nr:multidrug efflux RND transporter permease subunit [Acidobacteriaceae bacterium]